MLFGKPSAPKPSCPLRQWKGSVHATILVLSGTLVGCSTTRYPLDESPATVTYTGLTGNWELTTDVTTGNLPFTALHGYFREQAGDTGQSHLTTAALQAEPASDCYQGATLAPLQGSTRAGYVSIRSFSVNGQFLNLAAVEDRTITHLTGTFSINGGCANTTVGTFTGVRYATVAGVYAGFLTGASGTETVGLTLQQQVQGTGDGLFLVTGSATLSGNSCFTSGTLSSYGTDGNVSGSRIALNLTTNDSSGATVHLQGVFDPLAQVITITSATVSSGACAGTLGSGTLKLTP